MRVWLARSIAPAAAISAATQPRFSVSRPACRGAELAQGLAGAQYLIDFTRPEGTLEPGLLRRARHQAGDRHHRFRRSGQGRHRRSGQKTAIVFSPNFSVAW
jgi:dihydrodipicolinate reductase